MSMVGACTSLVFVNHSRIGIPKQWFQKNEWDFFDNLGVYFKQASFSTGSADSEKPELQQQLGIIKPTEIA